MAFGGMRGLPTQEDTELTKLLACRGIPERFHFQAY